jgi:hypothetical protein
VANADTCAERKRFVRRRQRIGIKLTTAGKALRLPVVRCQAQLARARAGRDAIATLLRHRSAAETGSRLEAWGGSGCRRSRHHGLQPK